MEVDIAEALRYLGVREDPAGELRRKMADVADKLTRSVRPRYVYRVFPLSHTPEGTVLEGSGITLAGETAGRMLEQCGHAALLLCTLGAGFETLLRAEQARDMARAVMLDACGSAWVEAGCDEAERDIAARFPGLYLTDRFSPGYGDLPLALQPAVCAALDASRRLGVQVTQSLLMNPTKSVTAVIGLAARPRAVDRPPDRSLGRSPNDDPQPGGLPTARIRGCGHCNLREACQFRKEGITCGA